MVSWSNGVGISTMRPSKPTATYSRRRSAIISGVPRSGRESEPTLSGVSPLWAIWASQTRSASLGSSRMTIQRLAVRSISAWSRPTASQCSRRTWSSSATCAGVPNAFHMSPYLASVRSVFLRPVPPIITGTRRTGCGLWRRSLKA